MCSATATAAAAKPTSGKRKRKAVWRGGRSYRDIHRMTGLSFNYIRRALGGRFVPRLDKFRLLAKALDRTVHDLAMELEITDPAPLKERNGLYKAIPPASVNRSQVAHKTGLSVSYMSRILNPDEVQRRQPRVEDLAILAKHFRCSMDHLIRCWEL